MAGREVFLAESRGLWRSRDAGETWGKSPDPRGRRASPSTSIRATARSSTRSSRAGACTAPTTSRRGTGPPPRDRRARGRLPPAPEEHDPARLAHDGPLDLDGQGRDRHAARAEHPRSDARDHPRRRASGGSGVVARRDRYGHRRSLPPIAARPGRGPATSVRRSPRLWPTPPPRRLVVAAGGRLSPRPTAGATWTPLYAPTDVEERVVDLERLDERHLARAARARGARRRPATTAARPGTRKRSSGRGTGEVGVGRGAGGRPAGPEPPAHGDADDGGALEQGRPARADPSSRRTAAPRGRCSTPDSSPTRAPPRENWNRGAVCGIDANSRHALLRGRRRRALPSRGRRPIRRTPPWAEVALTGAPAQPTFDAFLMTPNLPDVALATTIVVQLEGLDDARVPASRSTAARRSRPRRDPGTSSRRSPRIPALARSLACRRPDRRPRRADVRSASTGVPAIRRAGTGARRRSLRPSTRSPPVGLVAWTGGKDKLVRGWDLAAGMCDPQRRGPARAAKCSRSCALAATRPACSPARPTRSSTSSTARTGAPQDAKLEGTRARSRRSPRRPDGKTRLRGRLGLLISVLGRVAAGGSTVGKLDGHTGAVIALALSKDGTRLYSGFGGQVRPRVGHRREKELFAIPGHPGEVWAVALSARRDEALRRRAGRVGPRLRRGRPARPPRRGPSTANRSRGSRLRPKARCSTSSATRKDFSALGTADGQPMFTYTGSPVAADLRRGIRRRRVDRRGRRGRPPARLEEGPRRRRLDLGRRSTHGAIRCVVLASEAGGEAAEPAPDASATGDRPRRAWTPPPAPAPALRMDASGPRWAHRPRPRPGMDAPSAIRP